MHKNLFVLGAQVLGFSGSPLGREVGTRPHSHAAARLQGCSRSARVGGNTRCLALKRLALLHPSWPWEKGGGCLGPGNSRPSPCWLRIKAALGAGLLVWAGRRGRGTQLWRRHFKNLLLFHLNSLPLPKPVPPRMAFLLCNQGPRICAPVMEGGELKGERNAPSQAGR